MNLLTIIESVRHFFDVGIHIESIKNSFREKMEMDLKTFMNHLIFGNGFREVTPPALSTLLWSDHGLPIIDLRDEKKFNAGHIDEAENHPFDDFIKSVIMEDKYQNFRKKKLVLVCDTGHKSRVAASILVEENFTSVHSLSGGMYRWRKWRRLKKQLEKSWTSFFQPINCCRFKDNLSG